MLEDTRPPPKPGYHSMRRPSSIWRLGQMSLEEWLWPVREITPALARVMSVPPIPPAQSPILGVLETFMKWP